MATTETCPTCTEPATKVCSGCFGIGYCSRECQETDRPAHKLLCYTFAKSERPSERMRRALLFPPDSNKPVFLWMEIMDEVDENGDFACQQPKMGEQMGTDWPDYETIDHNAITGVLIGYHIRLCYSDHSTKNHSSRCQAVVNATGGMAQYPWQGSLLAFCGSPEANVTEDADIIEVTDMDMVAYSHVVAHLIDRENEEKSYLAMKSPKIQAVKLLCNGEMKASGKKRYEVVQLPRFHPLVRTDGKFMATSGHIGMLLVYVRCKTAPGLDRTNPAIVGMCENKDEEYEPGTVLIFREDFTPLDIETVVAFGAFCRDVYSVNKQQDADNDTPFEALPTAEQWASFLAKRLEAKDVAAAGRDRGASGMQEDEIERMDGLKLSDGTHRGSGALEGGGSHT